MITALSDRDNRILGIEAGAEDFISKPFDAGEVLARIKMLLHVKKLNDKLASANIELEAFNYSVSHDLRTPLAAISGYCQVVKEICSDILDEQGMEYIHKIYGGAQRMNQLIDTLLNFSRVERVEMRHEQVDLSCMAHAVAKELKESVPERCLTFNITDKIVVDGDADLLRVVMYNLLCNAWKYNNNIEGAFIEFGVTVFEEKPVCFVRDNGQGFEMSSADKLFIPFQRLPGTKAEGHGIGLATVERIVRRHGGRVWAKSEAGKGATFLFTLE